MPVLATTGRTVSYEVWGDPGPLVLAVHGSPGNARALARLGERLAGRARLIAPDLPGYGRTTREDGISSVVYAAESIEALCREVGPPSVLAGHSYGGVVALAMALRGQVRAGSLVLLEPVAVPVLAMAGEAETFAAAEAVFRDYVASVGRGAAGAIRTMVDFWFGAGAFDRMPQAVTAGLAGAAPANARDVEATFRERYTAEAFERLALPVVVVVGEGSPAITHRIARAIATHVPRGSVVPIAGATHAMPMTHADALADIIVAAAGAVG